VPSAFAFDARVLVCPQCGAPVHVSAAGGSFACGYCQNLIEVQPRPGPAVTGQAMAEHQRIFELIRQMRAYEDDRQNWPADFAAVARGGVTENDPGYVLSMWQSYCDRARAGDPNAGELAVLLTAPLSNYFSKHGQEERKRALFESTLEALPSPWHQEVMRCRLSGAALKAGDVDAARAWLASCDPAPLDLHADSSYRVAAGFMATFDRDFGRVLTLVGLTHGSIPVAEPSRLMIVMLRANALEKSGNPDDAVATLLDLARKSEGNLAEQGYAAAMKANSWLDLCSQSAPRAIAILQAHQAAVAATDTAIQAVQAVTAPAPPSQKAQPSQKAHRPGLFGRRKS
jgi:hypothetical protein